MRALWFVAALFLGGCVAEVAETGGSDPAPTYSELQPTCLLSTGVTFSCVDADAATRVAFDDGQGGLEPCTPKYDVPSCEIGTACFVTALGADGEPVHSAEGTCTMRCLGPEWCRAE